MNRARCRLAPLVTIVIAGVLTGTVAGGVRAETPRGEQSHVGTAARGRGHLLVVGDSLTFEANYHSGRGYDYLRRNMAGAPAAGGSALPRWRTVTVVFDKGQRVAWGLDAVREVLRANPRVSAIVVALGTNDATGRRGDWAGRIRALLDAAGDRPVYWLTLQFSPTARAAWRRNAREFNEALLDVDSEPAYGQRLTVVDWAAWFPASCPRGGNYSGDGIHLRRSGNRCRAIFMMDLSRTVHEALFAG